MKVIRLIVVSFFILINLQATSLRDSIEDTLNNNPSVIASHIVNDAYLKYIEQEEGDYLPTLDLDAFLEKSKTYNNPDEEPPAKGWAEKDGWNVALKFEYVLYDGGLTSSELGEFQYKYTANKFKSIYDVENIILETINTYVELVISQELVALAEDNKQIHEKYLEVAKEKEEISGEVLETYQVNSKYHAVLDRFLEQESDQYAAQNSYKRLVGKELTGNICRPNADEKYLPKSLKEAVELGLRRSLKVNEQIEKIKEQREIIAQQKAGFYPTVKFQLQGQWDDDLSLAENGRQDIYRGRILLNWNLYDGGKTLIATEKEQLFLKEEQKKLDEITSEVVEEINVAYYNYYNIKKRVENSSKFVEDNYNILMVYKKQLADGTRTFIDILNAESELYRSDIDKIDQEKELILAYYNLLNKMSMLSDVILMQNNQICDKFVFVPRKRDYVDPDADTSISEDLQDMFNETSTDDTTNNEASLDTSDSQEIENTNEIEVVEEKDTDTRVDTEDRLKQLYGEDRAKENSLVTKTTLVAPEKETEISNVVEADSSKETVLEDDQTLPQEKYTINMATLKTDKALKELISKYDLEDGTYHYRFGKSGENIKLLYGSYKSVKDAKVALDKLPRSIRDHVYIDNIAKHVKLETKYKEFN